MVIFVGLFVMFTCFIMNAEQLHCIYISPIQIPLQTVHVDIKEKAQGEAQMKLQYISNVNLYVQLHVVTGHFI